MAEFKIPVQIDGFKCVEEMAQAVLNYTYKGKTLQEWADSISKPKTNADRIRAMSDEELAKFLTYLTGICPPGKCPRDDGMCSANNCWLEWLRSEAE